MVICSTGRCTCYNTQLRVFDNLIMKTKTRSMHFMQNICLYNYKHVYYYKGNRNTKYKYILIWILITRGLALAKPLIHDIQNT